MLEGRDLIESLPVFPLHLRVLVALHVDSALALKPQVQGRAHVSNARRPLDVHPVKLFPAELGRRPAAPFRSVASKPGQDQEGRRLKGSASGKICTDECSLDGCAASSLSVQEKVSPELPTTGRDLCLTWIAI